ncbi:hypothetical protein [Pseudoalteromonas sp. MQS005]|uniref:hypothetical protein n=1 Tax=Pseudoalteromonas sp. MQS005 TaxID=1854052 RepID=UPI0018D2B095|nr:hypothetical protein [Pseudoalteromonas sp. MQS005]
MRIDTLEQELQYDPSASFWLKEQLEVTKGRDIVDSITDAELLVLVLKSRLESLEQIQN